MVIVGLVTTLGGSGASAYGDGSGTSAFFYYPTGIAVDSSGFIYAADQNNNRIRKISSSGKSSYITINIFYINSFSFYFSCSFSCL